VVVAVEVVGAFVVVVFVDEDAPVFARVPRDWSPWSSQRVPVLPMPRGKNVERIALAVHGIPTKPL